MCCITDDHLLDHLLKVLAFMVLHCNGSIFPIVSNPHCVGDTRKWKNPVSSQTLTHYFWNPSGDLDDNS